MRTTRDDPNFDRTGIRMQFASKRHRVPRWSHQRDENRSYAPRPLGTTPATDSLERPGVLPGIKSRTRWNQFPLSESKKGTLARTLAPAVAPTLEPNAAATIAAIDEGDMERLGDLTEDHWRVNLNENRLVESGGTPLTWVRRYRVWAFPGSLAQTARLRAVDPGRRSCRA